MMPKRILHRKPTLLHWFVFISAAVICGSVTGTSAQGTAIDEAMPDTIPTDVFADWKDQDNIQGGGYVSAIEKMKNEYPEIAVKINGPDENDYKQACHLRRVFRLAPFADIIQKMMFCEHHNFGNMVVGYHDNVDAGNSDQEWSGSSKLCIMHFKTYYPEIETLLSMDRVIRDPCISFDGKKCLMAISGSGSKGSGYSIYEMKIDDPTSLKQLTKQMDGISTADFEPCYLPNGDIMFTSTRNFALIAHAYNAVTNMFLMNGEGRFMRQVGFDQAHTFYPVLTNYGAVIYTRWEFNDRDLTNTMGLFMMYPDGSHQTEFFGNQTSWPYVMQQARPIPGSTKVVAIAGGHHGFYSGELMVIDNSRATNGPEAIQMVAPRRETKPTVKKNDLAQGGIQFLFEYPYPLSEKDFIVSWRSKESGAYRMYWMDQDGNRELLAWGTKSVCQAVPITTWKKIWGTDKPIMPKIQADYSRTEGTFTMENVYADPYCGSRKMDPIPKGTAKTLRVIELGYRAQGAGSFGSVMNMNVPSGCFAPAIFCPIAAFGCSWDAKKVLGEAKIYDDGSARFNVPARTPVYFQVLNEKGYCIATMRSWSTLMPGETFSCVGCHENKAAAPVISGMTDAMKNPPAPLEKPLGVEDKWFDFKKMVAPILDKNCAGCHAAGHASGFDMRNLDTIGPSRTWTTSYNSLTKGIGPRSSNNAINIGYIFQQSEPEPYGSFGSTRSRMIENIDTGHHDVKISDTDRKIIACWIDLCAPHGGYYSDYLTKSGYDKLEARRTKWREIERQNIMEGMECACIPGTPSIPPESVIAPRGGSAVDCCTIRYLQGRHALVFDKAYGGILLLVDFNGREILRRALPDPHNGAPVRIALPASMGAGLYVARFEGAGGIRQATVSLIK